MYKCNNDVFLSKEENELLKSKGFYEIDLESNPFHYVDGEDIDLF